MWLEGIQGGLTAEEKRTGYLDFFAGRLAASHIFEQEAMNARARLL